MTALWYFRPLFRRHAGRMAWTLLLTMLTLAAGIALLGVSGWFLTAAALSTAAVSFNLFGPSSLIRGLSLVRILSRYGEKLVGHDTTLRLLADLRGWLFASLFPRVPYAARDLRHGDLVSRLTADVDSLDTVFLVAIGPVVTALALGSAMAVLLFSLIPGAGLIYGLALLAAILIVPTVLVGVTRQRGREAVSASAETRMAVIDGIDGHSDLIAFGQTAAARAAFASATDRLALARRQVGSAGAWAAGAVQGLAGVSLLGVTAFGIGALRDGVLSGPVLVGLLLGVIASFEATAAIVRSIAKLGASMAAAERLKAIAIGRPPIADPVRPVPLPDGSTVTFSNVTFGHDSARPVLRGLDLTVPAGGRVAILGPSGSGKSTLLALLLRLQDPQGGSVSVAHTDIRAVAQRDLHRRVALLSQDTPVFLGTIRENLLIGRAEATDADLWHALDAARLADFVRGTAEGLDALVGETGRTLSAGQARRLCLARTLLSEAPVLAFDEPTAGLDRETEAEFLSDLARATRGRTILLSTHAGLPEGAVDRAYRLRDGKLEPADGFGPLLRPEDRAPQQRSAPAD
ncbi:thiol reductant ABC exporter subunit CydC [Microvirga antarctica]|uniref:thiol reductant ABC exporter subunit CydC n=1 Tax=Microvirga antarctica TaxID=2819233 RepID=UPI001B3183DB|nr:thiol reductant ABC exporter subunit CydC [Microvirga antarctica]